MRDIASNQEFVDFIEGTVYVCPRCGCKGKEVSHKRIYPAGLAQDLGYQDLECGSCGYFFNSSNTGVISNEN